VPADEPSHPGASYLALAVVLAAVHALWSLFQWTQLVRARSGGDYFCGVGGADDCAIVWDSALASAVRSGTGLPVAGWGLAWSAVAFALALWVLVRRARGRFVEPVWSATLLTALAGIAGVVILAGASLGSGYLCTTCLVTYALVLAFATTCLRETGELRFVQVRRGAVLALGATLVAFSALLYPGLRTPRNSTEENSALLEEVTKSGATPLDKLISRLSPQIRQELSDALAAYAEGDAVPLRLPRVLIGLPTAPVRITEFTDTLCVHCADFHKSMMVLLERLPRGSFALEPRQFPLDAECNPAIEWSSGQGVHCLAARAVICVNPESTAFADTLFENQRSLTTEKIYDLAAPFMSRERLEKCVGSPETEAKLREDIAWAMEYDIQGTPMVLVNGRKALAAPPFIYVMVLARADPGNPAFAALPSPEPRAELP
jgi:protein-disulfide isomerase